MKKVSKVLLATSIVFGTTFAASAAGTGEALTEAHAAETPYYNYTGYTSAQSNFILDSDFKRALEYDNVTINGYKLSKTDIGGGESVDVYDQRFGDVVNNEANMVEFQLANNVVSVEALKEVYGEPVEEPTQSPMGKNYQYVIGDKTVQFYVVDGYVHLGIINHY